VDYLKGRLGECSARAGGFAAERVWGWFEHPMGGGDALVCEVKSPGASRVSRCDLAVGGVTDARLGYKSPNGPAFLLQARDGLEWLEYSPGRALRTHEICAQAEVLR